MSISILHRILEEAVENREIASNPTAARGARVKPTQPKKPRIPTPEEVGRLLSAAGKVAGPSDALAIEVMFVLGLRIGEMAAGLGELGGLYRSMCRRELPARARVASLGGGAAGAHMIHGASGTQLEPLVSKEAPLMMRSHGIRLLLRQHLGMREVSGA